MPTASVQYSPDPGLSFPLTALLEHQPSTVIFWIVRHPLDAISSLRVGIADNGGHHPQPAGWQSWLYRPLVERCAPHWAWINEHGYARVRARGILVRFEDMIRDPMTFAKTG